MATLTMQQAEKERTKQGELKAIDVGYTAVEPLADWVGKVDLSGNKLANLQFLRNNTKVRCVKVAKNRLTRIPEQDVEGTQITTLDVSENPLETFEGVESIKTLSVFVAARCPETVGAERSLAALKQASNLTALVLRDIPLQGVSLQPVCQLKKLKKLSLSNCQLEMLPWRSKAHRLSNLAELRLNHNKLRTLDVFLSGCTSLRILDLGNNLLKEDCLSIITTLPHLTHLTLKSNPVADLPEYRGKVLEACRGKLKYLDDGFATEEVAQKKQAKREIGEQSRQQARKKMKVEPQHQDGGEKQTSHAIRANTVLVAVGPGATDAEYEENEEDIFKPSKFAEGSVADERHSGIVKVQLTSTGTTIGRKKKVQRDALKSAVASDEEVRSRDALAFLLGKNGSNE